MSTEAFERLCTLREALLSLGLGSLVDMLADGNDAAVEAALEALCKSEA